MFGHISASVEWRFKETKTAFGKREIILSPRLFKISRLPIHYGENGLTNKYILFAGFSSQCSLPISSGVLLLKCTEKSITSIFTTSGNSSVLKITKMQTLTKIFITHIVDMLNEIWLISFSVSLIRNKKVINLKGEPWLVTVTKIRGLFSSWTTSNL